MSKYINASELQKKLRATGIEIDEFIDQNEEDIIVDFYNGQEAGLMIASQFADELPSTEIIRCKDCKYANKERLPQGSKWFASCDHFNTHSVMADDYCSYAEWRESK